jgi:hypothetical protein
MLVLSRGQAGARMEAITSRAWLLAAVGRATKLAGQTTLYLTPTRAVRISLLLLIANIHAAFCDVRRVAAQFPATDKWKTLLDYIVAKNDPAPTTEAPRILCRFCRVTAGFRLSCSFVDLQLVVRACRCSGPKVKSAGIPRSCERRVVIPRVQVSAAVGRNPFCQGSSDCRRGTASSA